MIRRRTGTLSHFPTPQHDLVQFLPRPRAVLPLRTDGSPRAWPGEPAARGTLAFPPAAPLWRILWGKGGASAHHDFVIFQEMPPGPVKKNPPQIDIKKQ